MTHEQSMQLEADQHETETAFVPPRPWPTIQDLIDHLTFCDDIACDCGAPPDAAL